MVRRLETKPPIFYLRISRRPGGFDAPIPAAARRPPTVAVAARGGSGAVVWWWFSGRVTAFGRGEPERQQAFGTRVGGTGGRFSSAQRDWGKPFAFDRTAVKALGRSWVAGGYRQNFLTRRTTSLLFSFLFDKYCSITK